ncbi:MAG: Type 1 glutamine amidotransferase-like domain-containing protein [Rickettsiales bacterium]|jgi:dipeptidase E|nr:Type 1 glutamine amidotransferase-like domain-containing protein [Rickettsiales bacterium]
MKIVAIGGGQNGRKKTMPDGTVKQYPFDNVPINKKIIELSGKKNPNLLLLGTAGRDVVSFTDYLADHFKSLGANVSELKLAENNPTEAEMRKILDKTDIVYAGGGDTLILMNRWRETGFDRLLKEYGDQGVVLSGLSAGGICWFDYYDNDEYIDGDMSKLDFLPGLGFIKGFAVPHYDDKTPEEKKLFDNLLVKKGVVGYGIDNNAAIIFDNGKMSIMSSQPNVGIHYLNTPKQNMKERG